MFGHEIFLSVRFDQFLATDLQGIIICASDDLRHLTVRFRIRLDLVTKSSRSLLLHVVSCFGDFSVKSSVRYFPYRVPFSVPLSGRLDTWSVSDH